MGIAGVAGSAAVGPAPTLGPELGVAIRTKSVSIEMSGRVETTFGETRASSGDTLEATVIAGALLPCAHFGALSGCGFGRIGAFQGRAPDVASPSLHTSMFAAVGLRAAYTLDLGSVFALRGALEAGLPLVRTSLLVDGSSVWTAPPVFAGVSLAALVKIP